MDEAQNPSAGTPINSPIYQESQGKSAKWLWLLVVLLLVGGLVFAYVRGIGPFAQFSLTSKSSPSPSTQATSAEPSPDASPNIDKTSAKIRVLNGTGTVGVASSAKDFIESKGYKVSSIGNATKYDFTNTIIKLKSTVRNFEQSLMSDLSSKYSVEVSDSELEASDSADIEITIGSK